MDFKKIGLLAFFLVCGSAIFSQKLLKEIESAHNDAITSLVFKTDNSELFVSGKDKRTSIWNPESQGKIKSYAGHQGAVNAISINPNNTFIATAGEDGKVIIWNGQTGKPHKILSDFNGAVTALGFDPFTNRLVTGDLSGELKIWEAESAKVIQTIKNHSSKVLTAQFTPDGEFVVSSSEDKKVIFTNPESGNVSKEMVFKSSAKSVALSPNGRQMAVAYKSVVEIYDARSYELIGTFDDHGKNVLSLSYSADAQYIASSGESKKIIVWNAWTKEKVADLEGHDDAITAVSFSYDGLYLASGSADGYLRFWDTKTIGIGIRRFPASSEDPELEGEIVRLKDSNGNGIIELDDSPGLEVKVKNIGKGKAYNVMARIVVSPKITGLSFQENFIVGNILPGEDKQITIPIELSKGLVTTASKLKIQFMDVNGFESKRLEKAIQTKGLIARTYILASDPEFSSPSGKAEPGVPITMRIKLMNSGKSIARDVKIVYSFQENVLATDKLSESISEIQPGEIKTLSVDFYTESGFNKDSIKVGAKLEGEVASNIEQNLMALKMNADIPRVTSDFGNQVAVETGGGESLYRGGGDPLKGLNVSATKDIELGDYYAFIVGIDNYKGSWTPLRNAVNDAKSIEQTLRDQYKFEHFKSLYNEQATRENIIKEMEWLVSSVKPKDNVFIYYSGHGDFKQSLNKGYWVPSDATEASTAKYISNSDIQTFLGGISSKHTLLVSDACFSGDIFRGGAVKVDFDDTDKYYKEVYHLTSRQAITSGGLEPVMDGGKNGHSVFAYYFLRALKSNESKYLDAGQLYSKIKIPVTNNSEQSPKFSPVKNAGDEGGQFIFIKK